MPLNPVLPPPRRAAFQPFRDPIDAILHARNADELRLWYGWEDRGKTASGKTHWYNTDTKQHRYQISEPGTGRKGKQKSEAAGEPGEGSPQKPQKPAASKRSAKKPAVDHEAVGDRIQAMLDTGDFTDDDVSQLKQSLQGITRPQLAALRERFSGLGAKAGRSNEQGVENLAGSVAGKRKQQQPAPAPRPQQPSRKPPISIGPEDVEDIAGPARGSRRQTLGDVADEISRRGLGQKDKLAVERAANVEKYREQAERGERLFEEPAQKPAKKAAQPKPARQPRSKPKPPPPPPEPEDDGRIVVPDMEDFPAPPSPSFAPDDDEIVVADDDGLEGPPAADPTSNYTFKSAGERGATAWEARAKEPQPQPEQVSQVEGMIADAIRGKPIVNVAELRQQMPRNMRGRVFDEAVLSLVDSRRAYTSQDIHHQRFSDEQLGQYVQDGDGFLATLSLAEEEPQQAEIGVPPSEVPGSPVQQPPRLPSPPPAAPAKLSPEGERAAWFVEDALARGDMSVDDLRKQMPPNEVRDALDDAVAHLESRGKVRRGADGRLSFAGDKGSAKLSKEASEAARRSVMAQRRRSGLGRAPAGRGGAQLNARSPVGILLSARNINAARPLLYAWVREQTRRGNTVWVDSVTGERRYQDNRPGQRPGKHLPMRSVSPEEHLRRVLEAPYKVAEEHLTDLQQRLRQMRPAALRAIEILFPGGD